MIDSVVAWYMQLTLLGQYAVAFSAAPIVANVAAWIYVNYSNSIR